MAIASPVLDSAWALLGAVTAINFIQVPFGRDGSIASVLIAPDTETPADGDDGLQIVSGQMVFAEDIEKLAWTGNIYARAQWDPTSVNVETT
jgi:hypothetical protein